MSRERYLAAWAAHMRGEHEAAAEMIRVLAEEGFAPAQETLGNLYKNGEGVPVDLAQSFRWTLKAAEQGLGNAQLTLGSMFQFSIGVRQDLGQAEHWYTLAGAATEGAAERLAQLRTIRPLLPFLLQLAHADLFVLEAGVIRTGEELRTKAGSAAESLCAALVAAGWMEWAFGADPAPPGGGAVFRMTEPGRPGILLALETLRVAPEWLAPREVAPEPPAIEPSGDDYQRRATAHILAKDSTRAFAAHQARDFSTALPIFRALAEQGIAPMQFSLAAMLSRGEGVAADDQLALAWYEKAAAQGLEAAQHNAGLFRLYGRGGRQNLEAAEAWLRQAVAQNASLAGNDLALLLAAKPMLRMINELTRGDLATLEAVARIPADTTVIEGNPKHALYLEMEKQGWMKRKTPPERWGLPDARLFQTTDLGCIAIPKVMAIHAAWPGRMEPKAAERQRGEREVSAPRTDLARTDRDQTPEAAPSVRAVLERVRQEIERGSDDDVSPLRRIGTPVLVFAVLLFAVLGIIALFNLGPTGWPGRTSVLCCEPGKETP